MLKEHYAVFTRALHNIPVVIFIDEIDSFDRRDMSVSQVLEQNFSVRSA